MRTVLVLVVAALAACRSPESEDSARDARQEVAQALDAFHLAASRADGAAYFALLAPDAVFLGTDASERWTAEEFQSFAQPHFAAGRGWTYVATERHVELAPDRTTAWFDERLENAKYGKCRGTGVLRRVGGAWRIAQYNLTVPVPNELLGEVVLRIQQLGAR